MRSVAFSGNGDRLVTGSWDRTAKVWDARTGSEMLTLEAHSQAVNCVTFSPEGRRVLTGSSDGTVKVWDALHGRETLTLKVHPEPVTSAVFCPGGKRVATVCLDGTVRIWDALEWTVSRGELDRQQREWYTRWLRTHGLANHTQESPSDQ